MNSDRPSHIDNANIDGLSYPRSREWKLTGALTFYESPVSISNSTISNNHSEDALNIIRTHFRLSKSTFRGTFSDAFDSDFSNGKVTSCNFINIGNDAIDISGSIIDCDTIMIKMVGDKGVSAGEGSKLNLRNISISDSEIGVTSKDNSVVIGRDISITNTKLGYSVFEKKSEYGPGKINLNKSNLVNVSQEYLVEKGSELVLNGNKITKHTDGVAKLLYGNQYGKKSKK